LPTLIVIALIAFYPLTSVFVSSFTNAQFATSTPAEFVGLDNYKQLLSITIEPLPQATDPDTGQRWLIPRRANPS